MLIDQTSMLPDDTKLLKDINTNLVKIAGNSNTLVSQSASGERAKADISSALTSFNKDFTSYTKNQQRTAQTLISGIHKDALTLDKSINNMAVRMQNMMQQEISAVREQTNVLQDQQKLWASYTKVASAHMSNIETSLASLNSTVSALASRKPGEVRVVQAPVPIRPEPAAPTAVVDTTGELRTGFSSVTDSIRMHTDTITGMRSDMQDMWHDLTSVLNDIFDAVDEHGRNIADTFALSKNTQAASAPTAQTIQAAVQAAMLNVAGQVGIKAEKEVIFGSPVAANVTGESKFNLAKATFTGNILSGVTQSISGIRRTVEAAKEESKKSGKDTKKSFDSVGDLLKSWSKRAKESSDEQENLLGRLVAGGGLIASGAWDIFTSAIDDNTDVIKKMSLLRGENIMQQGRGSYREIYSYAGERNSVGGPLGQRIREQDYQAALDKALTAGITDMNMLSALTSEFALREALGMEASVKEWMKAQISFYDDGVDRVRANTMIVKKFGENFDVSTDELDKVVDIFSGSVDAFSSSTQDYLKKMKGIVEAQAKLAESGLDLNPEEWIQKVLNGDIDEKVQTQINSILQTTGTSWAEFEKIAFQEGDAGKLQELLVQGSKAIDTRATQLYDNGTMAGRMNAARYLDTYGFSSSFMTAVENMKKYDLYDQASEKAEKADIFNSDDIAEEAAQAATDTLRESKWMSIEDQIAASVEYGIGNGGVLESIRDLMYRMGISKSLTGMLKMLAGSDILKGGKLSKVTDYIRELPDKLRDKGLKGVLSDGFSGLKNIFTKTDDQGNVTRKSIKELIGDPIKNFGKNLWGGIKSLWTGKKNESTENTEETGLVETIKNAITGESDKTDKIDIEPVVIDNCIPICPDSLEQLQDILFNAIDRLEETLESGDDSDSLIDVIKDKIFGGDDDGAEEAADAAEEAADRLLDGNKSLTSKLKDFGASVWEKTKTAGSKIWSGAKSLGGKVKDFASKIFTKDNLNVLKGGASRLGSAVKSGISKIFSSNTAHAAASGSLTLASKIKAGISKVFNKNTFDALLSTGSAGLGKVTGGIAKAGSKLLGGISKIGKKLPGILGLVAGGITAGASAISDAADSAEQSGADFTDIFSNFGKVSTEALKTAGSYAAAAAPGALMLGGGLLAAKDADETLKKASHGIQGEASTTGMQVGGVLQGAGAVAMGAGGAIGAMGGISAAAAGATGGAALMAGLSAIPVIGWVGAAATGLGFVISKTSEYYASLNKGVQEITDSYAKQSDMMAADREAHKEMAESIRANFGALETFEDKVSFASDTLGMTAEELAGRSEESIAMMVDSYAENEKKLAEGGSWWDKLWNWGKTNDQRAMDDLEKANKESIKQDQEIFSQDLAEKIASADSETRAAILQDIGLDDFTNNPMIKGILENSTSAEDIEKALNQSTGIFGAGGTLMDKIGTSAFMSNLNDKYSITDHAITDMSADTSEQIAQAVNTMKTFGEAAAQGQLYGDQKQQYMEAMELLKENEEVVSKINDFNLMAYKDIGHSDKFLASAEETSSEKEAVSGIQSVEPTDNEVYLSDSANKVIKEERDIQVMMPDNNLLMVTEQQAANLGVFNPESSAVEDAAAAAEGVNPYDSNFPASPAAAAVYVSKYGDLSKEFLADAAENLKKYEGAEAGVSKEDTKEAVSFLESFGLKEESAVQSVASYGTIPLVLPENMPENQNTQLSNLASEPYGTQVEDTGFDPLDNHFPGSLAQRMRSFDGMEAPDANAGMMSLVEEFEQGVFDRLDTLLSNMNQSGGAYDANDGSKKHLTSPSTPYSPYIERNIDDQTITNYAR